MSEPRLDRLDKALADPAHQTPAWEVPGCEPVDTERPTSRYKGWPWAWGELVAYEDHHHDLGWRWLGFTMNLHMARLLADDWNRGLPQDCEACQREVAYIFGVPHVEDSRKEVARNEF